MPCLRPSYAVSAPLVCRVCAPRMPCLFPPASWRLARGQVALLALTRHRPDVHQVVSNLKVPDRANSLEVAEGLGQIFFELPQPLGLTTAEPVQVLDRHPIGLGVARVEAVQPQRQGLTAEGLALRPVDLRPVGAAVEACELGVNHHDIPARLLVSHPLLNQRAEVGPPAVGNSDGGCRQPVQGFREPVMAALSRLATERLQKAVGGEMTLRAEGLRPGQVEGVFPHVQVGLVELRPV